MSLVSIVTPTYNSEKYIEETITSILSQTHKNWELIVTDDCSTDRTISIIENFASQDKRIKLYKLDTNSGSGVARNNSIRHATGRFIAFCDSDDVWFKNKLEKQLEFIQKNNLSFTYSGYQIIDEEGNKKSVVHAKETINYNKILRNNYVHCFTSIYDTKKLGKKYMPEIRKRQDWVLWIKILKEIGTTKGITEPLGFYRIRKDSLSSNKLKLIQHNWNVYNKSLGYNVPESIFHMIKFMFYYTLKKINI